MKPYCRLRIPYEATQSLTEEYIAVPSTPDGIKMAEWWVTASVSDRVAIVNKGVSEDGNFVGAWKKHELGQAVPQEDLTSIVRRFDHQSDVQNESTDPKLQTS